MTAWGDDEPRRIGCAQVLEVLAISLTAWLSLVLLILAVTWALGVLR